MKVIKSSGREDIAMVYLAEYSENKYVEFVESVQPPVPRDQKWVLIVSTLFGCPVNCPICDAGGYYKGKLSKEQILDQIDYLITSRFPDRNVPVNKFKIQFARMGDPAFNPAVIDVLRELPNRYNVPGLMPCISTVAPQSCDIFFDKLLEVKNRIYKSKFQMQFSIHTTDLSLRDKLIPVRKWGFDRIARYGEKFYQSGDRKIALNFALAENSAIETDILNRYFNPEIFLIKITPVNPTYSAAESNIKSYISDNNNGNELMNTISDAGYEVILSIGELTENDIGSNCGQYVRRHLGEKAGCLNAYGDIVGSR